MNNPINNSSHCHAFFCNPLNKDKRVKNPNPIEFAIYTVSVSAIGVGVYSLATSLIPVWSSIVLVGAGTSVAGITSLFKCHKHKQVNDIYRQIIKPTEKAIKELRELQAQRALTQKEEEDLEIYEEALINANKQLEETPLV